MTPPSHGLLFNPDDIRNIVIRARMLGLRRERIFAALTRGPADPLTREVVRRIFDEEWPAGGGRYAERGSPRPGRLRSSM